MKFSCKVKSEKTSFLQVFNKLVVIINCNCIGVPRKNKKRPGKVHKNIAIIISITSYVTLSTRGQLKENRNLCSSALFTHYNGVKLIF